MQSLLSTRDSLGRLDLDKSDDLTQEDTHPAADQLTPSEIASDQQVLNIVKGTATYVAGCLNLHDPEKGLDLQDPAVVSIVHQALKSLFIGNTLVSTLGDLDISTIYHWPWDMEDDSLRFEDEPDENASEHTLADLKGSAFITPLLKRASIGIVGSAKNRLTVKLDMVRAIATRDCGEAFDAGYDTANKTYRELHPFSTEANIRRRKGDDTVEVKRPGPVVEKLLDNERGNKLSTLREDRGANAEYAPVCTGRWAGLFSLVSRHKSTVSTTSPLYVETIFAGFRLHPGRVVRGQILTGAQFAQAKMGVPSEIFIRLWDGDKEESVRVINGEVTHLS